MQTFLPYRDFQQCAACLDLKRLGKQRVETKQIYLSLTTGGGWKNHPAVKMWRGYESALCLYGLVMCTEWQCRGYRDSLTPFFAEQLFWERRSGKDAIEIPHWLTSRSFIRSHRSNLLRKDPDHYGRFNWNVPINLEYIWPEPVEEI